MQLGLKSRDGLNGARGHLVRFLKEEKRWRVTTDGEDDYETVNVKSDNLKRVDPKMKVYRHPITGQYMVPGTHEITTLH